MLKAKQLNGPYIVKDYVKSRKHEWYDACFIKNISDDGKYRNLQYFGNSNNTIEHKQLYKNDYSKCEKIR